jgi:glycosyltransferase involved in cell wall biosynthesis
LLLCVGSHEPRKNHLAVVAAADRLWQAGREFNLVFIGGNAWASRDFEHEVERLRSDGRPVTTVSAVSDELLWSAYRLAACTVFPSLNEGYGLPVAEAISVGTPVVTSRFGSMREITMAGGALLIDPRDDAGIAEALDAAMFDPAEADRLRAEALAVPQRTWDEYAAQLWAFFVDDPARG